FLPVIADGDDAVGALERQRPQDHRVDDAEDRRGRADAERQRDDRGQREAGMAGQAPQREAEIQQKGVHGNAHLKVCASRPSRFSVETRAIGGGRVAFARLSVVQVLLLVLLLIGVLVAMQRALLLLHRPPRRRAEPGFALHRERRRDQPLETRPAAPRTGRLRTRPDERLELPRTPEAPELVRRHARSLTAPPVAFIRVYPCSSVAFIRVYPCLSVFICGLYLRPLSVARPHRARTRAVISRLDGGFSPRPSECSASWITTARASSQSPNVRSANCRLHTKTSRLPGVVKASGPRWHCDV